MAITVDELKALYKHGTSDVKALVTEVRGLRRSLTRCRDALQTVASCHACGAGITLGFATHCVDCPAAPDAKDAEVDLDQVIQVAWESANRAL